MLTVANAASLSPASHMGNGNRNGNRKGKGNGKGNGKGRSKGGGKALGHCNPSKISAIKKCFCYLVATNQMRVKNHAAMSEKCQSYFGSVISLRSYAQTCIPFINPVGKKKVKQIVKKLNKCNAGISPSIELE